MTGETPQGLPEEGLEGRIVDLSEVTIAGLRDVIGLEPHGEALVEEVVTDPDKGIITD